MQLTHIVILYPPSCESSLLQLKAERNVCATFRSKAFQNDGIDGYLSVNISSNSCTVFRISLKAVNTQKYPPISSYQY